MSSYPLGPPAAVSPLLRGARFALLVGGIFYGITKQALYSKMEESWRVEEAKRKAVRDRELAIIKARQREEEKTYFVYPPKGSKPGDPPGPC